MQRFAEAEPEAFYKTTLKVSKVQTRRFEDGLIEIDVIRTERFFIVIA